MPTKVIDGRGVGVRAVVDSLSKEREPGLRGAPEGWPTIEPEVVEEHTFRRLIAIERRRTERSRAPFVLMLVEPEGEVPLAECLVEAMLRVSRETDRVGWYAGRRTLGVIFTSVSYSEEQKPVESILCRVEAALQEAARVGGPFPLRIESHLYPDDWKDGEERAPVNPVLFGDMLGREKSRWLARSLKRGIDLVGSAAALTVLSPLMVGIALAVKFSSPGPIFFRQQRVGQYGHCFTFLKFRSMVVNNDASEHRAYVEKLIAGQAERHGSEKEGEGVYKLANDRRVTRVGSFLRRSSLDELPQFLNVLLGDMSLVGPRPPIPYELEAYQPWHRRRILEARPGITGLWQVTGRSRVTFDEMVRLDLQYASTWTPWMDVKILLRTPLAVIRGSGAH